MPNGQGSLHFANRGPYAQQQQQANQPPAPFSASLHIPPSMSNMSLSMQQQQQQYPGINSIPGMHSMGIQGLQGLQTMHSMPSFQGMHGMQTMPSMPSMPGMQTMSSLMHPQQDSPHHQSNAHLPSHFGAPGVAVGGVDKRKKGRKRTANFHSHNSVLSSDDAHSMMLAAQHAAEAASVPAAGHSMSMFEADGITFRLVEQLPDQKIKRLRDEKIKPIEELTFEDIKAYNRNQLRAYCYVYGIKRKKKAEMERNMAKYAALFHPHDPAFDLQKFEPTEYAEGPIPRRKVPVTKEQKEQASCNTGRLTSTLHQRPQPSAHQQYHPGPPPHHGHHGLPNHHAMSQHHSVSHRLHDLHSHHQHGGPHHHHTHDEHEAVVAAAHEMINVPDTLHVPTHLLGISHQMGEE